MNNVRQPLFDGVQDVRALWFDGDTLSEKTMRRRILSYWQQGARLYRFEGNRLEGSYLLEWPSAKRVNCRRVRATPLCNVAGALSSAPLPAGQTRTVATGEVWLVRGAELTVLRLGDAKAVDPAAWIDVSGIAIRTPLKPNVSTHDVALDDPEAPKDLRKILGDKIPEADGKQKAFLEQLQAARDGKTNPLGRRGQSISTAAREAAGKASMGILGLVASLLGVKGGTGKVGTMSPAAGGLSNLLARMAVVSRLSKLLGWRQAAYMRKMMQMFDDGDINAALRHAIPLNSLTGQAERPAFGVPRARNDLTISSPSGVSANIGIDMELQNYLQQLYRRTFERLDREDRIDEAVYVLAELLKQGEEAVTYLEKKGRLAQAAELAETLDLAPEIAVRLWWLAGDRERAKRIAQRSQSFAAAVMLLERNGVGDTAGLRQLWAEQLYKAGYLIEAAEALWPAEQHRELAMQLLMLAQQAGGQLGQRALVRMLAYQPESLEHAKGAIDTYLAGHDEESAAHRVRLVEELNRLTTQSSATKRLASALAPKVITDRSAGFNLLEARDINALLNRVDDAVLKADLPKLRFPGASPVVQLHQRWTPLEITCAERGLHPVQDACLLLDGDYLIACGESGLLRVNKQGRTLVHFPAPAHRIVPADNCTRVLALAKRDKSWRATRIDLLTRKSSDWLMLPFTFCADTYDGVTWNLVLNNRLVAIDTTQDRLVTTWQVADLPGQIQAFAQSSAAQVLLIASGNELEQWRYLLPARRLYQRDLIQSIDSDVWRVLASPNNDEPLRVYLLESEDKGNVTLRARRIHASSPEIKVEIGRVEHVHQVLLEDDWLILVTTANDVATAHVIEARTGTMKARLHMPGSSEPRCRVHMGHLLMFDQAGRLIALHILTSTVRLVTMA